MLKKAITYVDFNGVEHTENFYFNLMKAELAEMELSTQGGFAGYLQRIVDSNDGKQIIDTFKEILFKAYGQKSADGRRFVKSEELSKEFEQTEAYSVLFMELVTNAEAGAAFVNGLMPAGLETSDQPSVEDIRARIATSQASTAPIAPQPAQQPSYPVQEQRPAASANPYESGQLEIPDFPQNY